MWSTKLLWLGPFCTAFSGYLFAFRGPANNASQLGFRVALLTIGLAATAAGLYLQSRRED